jgi:hypothetical protein
MCPVRESELDEMEHEMAGLEAMSISEGLVKLVGDGGCGVGGEEYFGARYIEKRRARRRRGSRCVGRRYSMKS